MEVVTVLRGCQTDPVPQYEGPHPALTICDGNRICVADGAEIAFTKYLTALKRWASDTEQLCKGEDDELFDPR